MSAVKRGESGICCVVGVDKPTGVSSHDVVNSVRRVFGERRVGHTGTLDPLATGALAVCVGPATRLNQYLTCDDKTYQVRIAFGVATDTDDSCGEPVRVCDVPMRVCDPDFAVDYVSGLVGKRKQMPPAYSAIKKNGVKSYEAARKGLVIELEPRDIEIYRAELLAMQTDISAHHIFWDLEVSVSKGTYIRSLARDIGASLGTAAHVDQLRRIASGRLHVDDCRSLERLSDVGLDAAIDPVYLLGFPMVFLDEHQVGDVRNGKSLKVSMLRCFEAPRRVDDADCGPRRGAVPICRGFEQGERLSLVSRNELIAIFEYDAPGDIIRPCCVFSQGVTRGKGV